MSTSNACSQTPIIRGSNLFGYRVGQEFWLEGHPYRVSRQISNTETLLERLDTLSPRNITKSEFDELLRTGKVKNQPGFDRGNTKFHIAPPSDEDLMIAIWRMGYVKAFFKLPKGERKERLVHELRDREAKALAANNDNILPPPMPPNSPKLKPPSIATLYRWARRYNPDVGPLSLLSNHFKSGRKSTQDSAAVENIVKDGIQTMIDNKNLTRADAVINIQNALKNLAKKDPAYASVAKFPVSAIYRRMRLYGQEFHTALALGRRAADNRFRPVMVANHDDRALSCIEIDNTQLDVFVRISEEEAGIVKPYMTLAMDVATRSVLSIRISLLAPNEDDICRLLVDMLHPKDQAELKKIGVESGWPMHGMPAAIKIDNGREFISAKVTRLISALGIEQVRCPPKTPRYKGIVERTFRTLNQLGIHQFPGYTRGNPALKGDARPDKDRLLTFLDIERLILKLICDVYHTHPHSALDMPPLVAWARAVSGIEMRLPPSADDLRFLLHDIAERKLTRQGIKINGLTYNSYETRDLLDVYGEDMTVDVHWDPSDLGRVFVVNPSTKHLVALSCVDRDVDGLDLRTHEHLQKASRTAAGKIDEEKYLKLRAEFIDLVASISGRRPSAMMPRGAKKSKRRSPNAGRIDDKPIKSGGVQRTQRRPKSADASSPTLPVQSAGAERQEPHALQIDDGDFEIISLDTESSHDDR